MLWWKDLTLKAISFLLLNSCEKVPRESVLKVARDRSLDSLLDDDTSKYASMTTSNTDNSISTLNSADWDEDMNQTTTPTPERNDGNQVQDSNKNNKTAFGTLQMKVQEIRAQLDVLKSAGGERNQNQCLQMAINRVTRHPPPTTLPPPPPVPTSKGSLQHPNTPAQGYEHQLPPNVIKNLSHGALLDNSRICNGEVFFPLFPTNSFSDTSLQTPGVAHKDQLLQLQRSLMHASNQNVVQNSDSASPPSSPSHNTSKGSSSHFVAVPFRLPLSVATNIGTGGGSLSTSPSTLSPCSSNSLPSSSNMPHSASSQQLFQNQNHPVRPQGLKLHMSQSMQAFTSSKGGQTPAENKDKLFFFFDVIMTQEKIAKVKNSLTHFKTYSSKL